MTSFESHVPLKNLVRGLPDETDKSGLKRIKADLNYFIRTRDYSVDVLGLCSVLWAMSCRADLRRGFPHTAGSLLPAASADGWMIVPALPLNLLKKVVKSSFTGSNQF